MEESVLLGLRLAFQGIAAQSFRDFRHAGRTASSHLTRLSGTLGPIRNHRRQAVDKSRMGQNCDRLNQSIDRTDGRQRSLFNNAACPEDGSRSGTRARRESEAIGARASSTRNIIG